MSAKLSIKDLSFTYPDKVKALKNVNLDIQPRELFVLMGPSRSGKSTLLRLMNRLSDLIDGSERDGTIEVDGQDIFARCWF